MTDVAVESFREKLIGQGLLLETGVPGLFGKSAVFETTLERVDSFITREGSSDKPEVVRFPPFVSRANLARSGYMVSFPQLAGSIHSFAGDSSDHAELLATLEAGNEWAAGLPPTELSLTPAACYPVYPTVSSPLPAGGRLFDVMSYCFRHEPSNDIARMQAFRMHEFVRLGSPEEARTFRDEWITRYVRMLTDLGLEATVELANDPFFGRGGRLLSATQREQSLKFEVVAPCSPGARPSALGSCNYHLDHLANAFGIRLHDGSIAHTACVGLGLERVVLALFAKHGLKTSAWPGGVSELLELNEE
ncbi:MAG: amino acid--[acyl-carrier-protein] ligase [Gemmatimonadaceae bacterium]